MAAFLPLLAVLAELVGASAAVGVFLVGLTLTGNASSPANTSTAVPAWPVPGEAGTTPPRRPTALNTNSVAAWLSHACWLHGLWASAIRRARHSVRRVDPGALLRSTGYATVRLCTLGRTRYTIPGRTFAQGQRDATPRLDGTDHLE